MRKRLRLTFEAETLIRRELAALFNHAAEWDTALSAPMTIAMPPGGDRLT